MEIITADLNDYLRIYLLPSVLAFLFVYAIFENDVTVLLSVLFPLNDISLLSVDIKR